MYLDDSFTKLGDTMVYYFDQNKTYVEARRHCKSYDSHLLEIWNVEEWNEVKIDYSDSKPIW